MSEAQDTTIGAIRARWGTVPGGPWRWDDQPEGVIRVWFPEPHDLTIACLVFPGDMETYEGPDLRLAEAIAHAPQDVATLLAALDAAEAREAALAEAIKLIGPALVGYDGFKTVWCAPCDREIGAIPECCADCPHGAHCPLALYDALAASPAPGVVAGEEGR